MCIYEPIQGATVNNCTQHQFYSKQTCYECDKSCLTCHGPGQTSCSTCPRGNYLFNNSITPPYCVPCHILVMYYGPQGECVERCGDGVNYGLNECDDGNTLSGDGCSSTCAVEQGWSCAKGSYTSRDVCLSHRTQIIAINVTQWNNLVVEFTQDVVIVGELGPDDFQIYLDEVPVNWTVSTYFTMPTKVLYF